ncbi:MAG: hypothetical protein JW719_06545 [Pirellulales bacterium]|nr:hypothetical protein [Pirellulales bacterium]
MVLSLFSRNRQREVQSFVLNLINNHCPDLHIGGEELRLESRINLTVVVLVVPIKDGQPRIDECLVTVSKEFSNTGLSLVLAEPFSLDEVILGFQRRGSTTFLRAKAKHLSPMGAGFFQLGFKLLEVLATDAYPELETLADRF